MKTSRTLITWKPGPILHIGMVGYHPLDNFQGCRKIPLPPNKVLLVMPKILQLLKTIGPYISTACNSLEFAIAWTYKVISQSHSSDRRAGSKLLKEATAQVTLPWVFSPSFRYAQPWTLQSYRLSKDFVILIHSIINPNFSLLACEWILQSQKNYFSAPPFDLYIMNLRSHQC